MPRSWLLLLVIAACNNASGGGGGDDDDDMPPGDGGGMPTGNGQVFDSSITDVVIEIDFEAGQQPFTGPTIGMGDTFDLSQANIERLFAGKKQIVLPRTLDAMQDIGNIADEELTVSDILDIAAAHRDQQDSGATRTYYVVFVSGHFDDGTGPQQGVLGVSIGTTGVIAMFKDVIRSTNVVGTNVVRFVEQSTLIHELAHSFGLVDNGVPMVQQHRDTEHGKHCDNDRCVMFFLNEGASDAAAFVQQQVLTGNSILFDANCLADVDAQTGGP
jgi:hypothetical protein